MIRSRFALLYGNRGLFPASMISDAQEIIDFIDIEASEVETLQIADEPERQKLIELVQALPDDKLNRVINYIGEILT